MNVDYILLKNHLIKLIPFFCTTIFYFALVHGTGDFITTVLKCAPIVSLMFYIVSSDVQCRKTYIQCQGIFLGLIFSCVGDILLNIERFPHGMLAFALAQLCYIAVFGWKPLKLKIAVILYTFTLIAVALVYKNLDNILIYGLPIYAIILTTQCWRSLARAQHSKHFLNILCGIGSLSFVVSDTLIALDMFLIPVPSARIWIMLTYYFAQFAITISIVNQSCPTTNQNNQYKKNIQD